MRALLLLAVAACGAPAVAPAPAEPPRLAFHRLVLLDETGTALAPARVLAMGLTEQTRILDHDRRARFYGLDAEAGERAEDVLRRRAKEMPALPPGQRWVCQWSQPLAPPRPSYDCFAVEAARAVEGADVETCVTGTGERVAGGATTPSPWLAMRWSRAGWTKIQASFANEFLVPVIGTEALDIGSLPRERERYFGAGTTPGEKGTSTGRWFDVCQGTAVLKLASAREAFASADALYHAGAYDEARGVFLDVHVKFPREPLALLADLRLADMEFARRHWASAAMLYASWANLHPFHELVPAVKARAATAKCRTTEPTAACPDDYREPSPP